MSLFGSLFDGGKPKVEITDIQRRFNLITRVGQGSMSRVWKADDEVNGRMVAVKVLDKEKTLRYENRFRDLNKPSEGEIALSLKHPNIVQTYEVGFTPEHEMFLVMEYVEGSGLALQVDLQSDQMRRYRTRYMIQIGEALSYFHRQNWIHRDICPRNIMVTEKNDIKLIDFGLAVPNTPDFRKPGNRTGTANYMAPELIKRRPTDQRIDVFSYAVTCFEMYAKRHPWDSAMTIDAVLHHINKPPIQLAKLVPGIDSEIADIIMKGLAAEPDDRWPSVHDMMKAFRNTEVRLVKATQQLLARRKQAATSANTKKASGGDAATAQSGSAKPIARKPSVAGRKPTAKASAEIPLDADVSDNEADTTPKNMTADAERPKDAVDAKRTAKKETVSDHAVPEDATNNDTATDVAPAEQPVETDPEERTAET